MKTIVISAVNIRKGGTLTILRDCLSYLSTSNWAKEYRIVAIVHNKSLCFYNNIEYIEIPWSIKGWLRRLWCEYVTMYNISKDLGNIDLWLSMHDTTPRVRAKVQAVYCQTSFPFYKFSIKDFRYNPKIPLFSIFTKYAYKINIRRNKYLIVQANWLREGFSKMFNIDKNKFIVASPESPTINTYCDNLESDLYTFVYPATADVHKNFNVLLEASRILENRIGKNIFRVVITLSGSENKYAKHLFSEYNNTSSIIFKGYLSRKELFNLYSYSNALVFPSLIETWGLPISEFSAFNKPMLLSDLPFAHETSIGSKQTAFFNPKDPQELSILMERLIYKDDTFLKSIPHKKVKDPKASNWNKIFIYLLDNN